MSSNPKSRISLPSRWMKPRATRRKTPVSPAPERRLGEGHVRGPELGEEEGHEEAVSREDGDGGDEDRELRERAARDEHWRNWSHPFPGFGRGFGPYGMPSSRVQTFSPARRAARARVWIPVGFVTAMRKTTRKSLALESPQPRCSASPMSVRRAPRVSDFPTACDRVKKSGRRRSPTVLTRRKKAPPAMKSATRKIIAFLRGRVRSRPDPGISPPRPPR
jgi:hypothetical protein